MSINPKILLTQSKIYVNKDADAEFEISFTGEYAFIPTTIVYNRSPVDGVMTIDDGRLGHCESRISIKNHFNHRCYDHRFCRYEI